jgi:hypothetical protein
MVDPALYINRELSWIAFNYRVLAQALNEHTPLLEQAKFSAIFSNNLDEFFMVRVASLKSQEDAGITTLSDDGLTPQQQIAAIQAELPRLLEMQQQHYRHSLKSHLADAILSTALIALLAYFFRAANISGWLPHLIFAILGGASKYGVSWVIREQDEVTREFIGGEMVVQPPAPKGDEEDASSQVFFVSPLKGDLAPHSTGAIRITFQPQSSGDYSKALAAYNWGPGNVDKTLQAYGNDWRNHLPAETSNYVASIMAKSGSV